MSYSELSARCAKLARRLGIIHKAWSDAARAAALEARRANAGPKSREDWQRAGAEGRAQMERIWGPTKPGTRPYQGHTPGSPAWMEAKRGGPLWEYTDATGVTRQGFVESFSDRGGTDVTHIMRRDNPGQPDHGRIDVLSGSRLKAARVLNKAWSDEARRASAEARAARARGDINHIGNHVRRDFDLTHFSKPGDKGSGNWTKFKTELGLEERGKVTHSFPGSNITHAQFLWENPKTGLKVKTGNHPETGEFAQRGPNDSVQRTPEKGYASYVTGEGPDKEVKRFSRLLLRHATYQKDRDG